MNSKRNLNMTKRTLNGKVLLLLGVTIGCLLLGQLQTGGSLVSAAQSDSTPVTSNQVQLKTDGKKTSQQGVIFDNKTWIPLTFLRDELKLPLTYESASRTYIITQDTQKLKLTVYEGGIISYLNGHYLATPEAKLVKGRIYVPYQWLKDFMGYEGVWDGKLKQLDIVKAESNNLELKTISHKEDRTDAVISLNVPSVSIPDNAAAEKAINKVLEADNAKFQDEIKEALKNREGESKLPPYEFNSSYIVTYNQKGLLSILIDKYDYTGGAHGGTVRQAYNFNLEDGSLLTLKELFGDNSSYMKVINGDLKEGFESHPGYFGGFNGIGNDFTGYYLQGDQVTFFFQVYDYTPYAAGIPEYSISYEKLLKKDSHYHNLLP